MARIPSVGRALSSAIPLARGVADRAATTAAPLVAGLVGRVRTRVSGRSRTEPTTPETFVPSVVADEPAPAGSEAKDEAKPSPATVARNVAGPRPVAKASARNRTRAVPGAKLPVTRPST